MIKAAIFDLDGLLINSEPFWQEAEIEVFATVGLHLTNKQCTETMGFRIDEAVAYWYNKHPWGNVPQQTVADNVVKRLKELITEKGQAMPGVMQTLEFFRQKNIPMAVASSSYMDIIDHAVNALGIREYFVALHSAQHEEYGKPHPAIFIKTAQALQVRPEECIVFEDSFYGLVAAKAAKMKAVAVPDRHITQPEKYAFADVVLNTLKDWDENIFEAL